MTGLREAGVAMFSRTRFLRHDPLESHGELGDRQHVTSNPRQVQSNASLTDLGAAYRFIVSVYRVIAAHV